MATGEQRHGRLALAIESLRASIHLVESLTRDGRISPPSPDLGKALAGLESAQEDGAAGNEPRPAARSDTGITSQAIAPMNPRKPSQK